ncbi:MAG: cyclic nucleotide-binding domain-containing protein [Actinomycetota bacterium]|nr:cyclic nucleotide-binding domain-containing protein [Actinomycetota bacterium]
MVDRDSLARLALFTDLTASQLEDVAHTLDEERHRHDTHILREGLSGNSFYVILDGEVSIRVSGIERTRLGPGEFFGELSILTGEPFVADVVVASEELRCVVLAGPELRTLLLRHPPVAIRILEQEARRLRNTTLWHA